jgi:hypothetical protein
MIWNTHCEDLKGTKHVPVGSNLLRWHQSTKRIPFERMRMENSKLNYTRRFVLPMKSSGSSRGRDIFLFHEWTAMHSYSVCFRTANIKFTGKLKFLLAQSYPLRGSWQSSLFPQGAVYVSRSMDMVHKTEITGCIKIQCAPLIECSPLFSFKGKKTWTSDGRTQFPNPTPHKAFMKQCKPICILYFTCYGRSWLRLAPPPPKIEE